MTRFLIIGCSIAALASMAAAQATPKIIPRAEYLKVVDNRFSSMDANHDGQVTKAEVAAQQQRDFEAAKARINQELQAQFGRLDTNHDGKLTLPEFLAGAPGIKVAEGPDQLMARVDANHDGKISAAEFRDPELAKFNRVDANHDGMVTPQEQAAAKR